MEKYSLKAKKRTVTGRKVKNLRKQGILPANIYGKKVKSIAIEVAAADFLNIFSKAGETGLVEVGVDGEVRPVLIHNIAYDPVYSKPIHVDFLQVSLKEKVTTHVPIEFVGEAPAVVNKIGVLLKQISEVEVEALPGDLPERIDIDVNKLTEIDQLIKVADIKIAAAVKILTPAETTIVQVAPLVSKEAERQAAEEEAAKVEAAALAATEAAPVEEGKVSEEAPIAPHVVETPKEEKKEAK
ncbi:50S ribosomal protein L25 [Candidatus Gottesmanbacteria bacterium]|nr:50S ribosomal protein L25 [Candidatus Gottesmanbacteria bacterium]